MKKKLIIFVLILLETLGIIAIGFLFAKRRASYCVYNAKIPDGMQLTMNKDISLIGLNNSTIELPEGTKVIPFGGIIVDSVEFNVEGKDEILSANINCFCEIDQLKEIQNDAAQMTLTAQRRVVLQGLIICSIIGICWIVLAVPFSVYLLKKNNTKMLFCGHFVIIGILFVIVATSAVLV